MVGMHFPLWLFNATIHGRVYLAGEEALRKYGSQATLAGMYPLSNQILTIVFWISSASLSGDYMDKDQPMNFARIA
jgi:hypothetical protein